MKTMLFNPYTGAPRHPDDIKSDPQGLLIAEPDEPMRAAAKTSDPSPTAGMDMAQRILHVGGRNNAAGYVEFGSVQAVTALMLQFVRDMVQPPMRRVSDGWKAALQQIAAWDSHDHMLGVDMGSNGVRDFYRQIARDALASAPPAPETKPIDMVLHCPACGMQHIDKADPPVEFEPGAAQWNNPPHRSHLCHGCGHIWRPADVPTNGVQAVKTKGKADSPLVGLKAAVVQQEPVAYVCPTSHATADGSMEDGPEYLEWADEASDYEKRVGIPLYTHPAQQAKPQPLSEPDLLSRDSSDTDEGCAALYRAHGIK